MTDVPSPNSTRRNFIIGSVAAVSTFFIGRSRSQAGQPELTLKFATVASPGTPWAEHANRIKKRVKKRTNGRVKIKLYLGGVLGGENSTASRCHRGGIAGWFGTAGALASIVPDLAALELPYLFPDLGTVDDILDNKIKTDVAQKLQKAGFKLLFFSENGYRSIGSDFGFIKRSEDLKGKKMRSQQLDVHQNTWRALGASPLPIPVTETLTLLRSTALDGFDNTPLCTFAASWQLAITHFTLTRHCYQPALAVMHLDTWKGLSKAVKKSIQGDANAESAFGREGVRAIRQQLIENFVSAGIQVHESTTSELQAFISATRPTHKQFTDKYGSAFYDSITKHL